METSNMTPERREQILKEMKEKQQKKEALEHKQSQSQSSNQPSVDNSQLAEMQKQINALQEQVLTAKESADNYKQQYETLKNETESEKDEKVLNTVLDSNRRLFVKEYTLDVDDAKPERLTVKLHYPSALDLTKVEREYESLTGSSLSEYTATRAQNIMLGIAYFRIVGEQVPKWLTDPELLERWDIVAQIIDDYLDWVATFQKTITQ